MDEESSQAGGEAAKEEEGEEDGEWLSGYPGLAEEGGAEGGEAGPVVAFGGGDREPGPVRIRDRVLAANLGTAGPPSRSSFLVSEDG